MLSIGGKVRVDPGSDKVIGAVKDLPAGPLSLIGVDMDGHGNAVTDDELKRLAGARKMTGLYLHGTKVTDSGLAYLKEMTELRLLWLQDTAVTDSGLEHLASKGKLTELSLTKTKVTAAGVAKPAKTLPKCRIEHDGGTIEPTAKAGDDRTAAEWVMSVGGSVRVNGQEQTLKALANLPVGEIQLELVDFNFAAITDEGLAHLKGCKHLEVVGLDRTPIGDAGLAHLKACPKLTTLKLEATKVTDAGLTLFRDHPSLQALFLPSTR